MCNYTIIPLLHHQGFGTVRFWDGSGPDTLFSLEDGPGSRGRKSTKTFTKLSYIGTTTLSLAQVKSKIKIKKYWKAHHRRRRVLNDKAKAVASVWGAKFVPFLAALAVFPQSI